MSDQNPDAPGTAEVARCAVVIPTRNRKELLCRAVASALAQSIPVHVLVMDDASEDGTEATIRQRFPQVSYVRSEEPAGPTFQRNRGAELTSAEFLMTLDDDCVIESTRTLEQVLASFDDPRVGAVTVPFVNVLQDDLVRSRASDSQAAQITFNYFGGMIAFRRAVYLAAGGYREYFFMHVEEPDLAVRMLNAGYVIRLGTSDPIHHLESPVRNRPRLDVLGPRNHVLYAWYNVPMPYLPLQLAATTALTLRHGVRRRTLLRVVKGLAQGYAGIVRTWGERRAVTRAVYRLSRHLKKADSLPLQAVEPLLPPAA